MKYLVMECHPGYVVVLDEKGRFQKAANLGYEVGQSLDKVVLMREPKPAVPITRMASALAAAAACFILMFTVLFQGPASPYGSVYMQINPEIRMDVDRENQVLLVEGVNEDGKELVAGYTGYENKHLETVADELVDLAEAKGYLSPGGTVHVYLDSLDGDWAAQVGDQLNRHLHETFTDIVVEVDIHPPVSSEPSFSSAPSEAPAAEPSAVEILIPTAPVSKPESSSAPVSSAPPAVSSAPPPISSSPAPSYSETDYGMDDWDQDDDGDDWDDTREEPDDDAGDADDPDDGDWDGPEDPQDGVTDYGVTSYSEPASQPGSSPYEPDDDRPDNEDDADGSDDDDDYDDNDDYGDDDSDDDDE